MLAFMIGEPLTRGVLVAGLALAGVTLALGFKGRVAASAVAAVATVCVMAVMREIARRAYLKPYFDPQAQPVAPEPSTVAMFLACFALALIAIWWAVRPAKSTQGA